MNTEQRFPIPGEWISEEDQAIAASVHRWADQQLREGRAAEQSDRAIAGARGFRHLAHDLGLLGVMWPEDKDGLGQNQARIAFQMALLAEQIGRADVGLGLDFAIHQALGAALNVGLAPGRDLALAAALIGPQADPRPVALIGPILHARPGPQVRLFEGRALQARARAAESGWILDAEEARPLNAGAVAGTLAVLAHLEGGEVEGPGLFLLPAEAKGVTRSAVVRRAGLWSSPNATCRLEAVTLEPAALVLAGPRQYHKLWTWLRLLAASVCQGALLAVDAIVADWGENRVIKGRGQVFRDNPLAAAIMGDLASQIACGRALTFQLAYLLAHPEVHGDPGQPAVRQAAQNVCQRVCQAAAAAIGQAMELMGSAGYAREWNLERYWRDVRTLHALLGADPLARVDLARYHYGSQAWPLPEEV